MFDVANSNPLRIQFDAHHCHLPPAEVEKMREGLAGLGEQVCHFPVADLHVLIERNHRTNDYSVKTSLRLPGETLVSSDTDPGLHTAFERCLASLTANLQAYKGRLGRVEERQKQEKGTHQDLHADLPLDREALEAALAEEDYVGFRTASVSYEEPVRLRLGRWIERYPDQAARIDRDLKIADFVEEVFLQAFDQYAARPQEVRFGEWLESLIDPAIRTLSRKGERELEHVQRMRSLVEATQGRA